MKIYYDGVLKVTYTGIWVPRTNEWLWLSVGASFGDIGTFTSEANGLLTSAYVDYVRVWQSSNNTPPVFNSDPIVLPAATHDQSFSGTLNASAMDSDGDLLTYSKLSGPGWLQSAITLGGGSLAGSLYLGVLGGPSLLWLQPLAMLLGVVMLAAGQRHARGPADRAAREAVEGAPRGGGGPRNAAEDGEAASRDGREGGVPSPGDEEGARASPVQKCLGEAGIGSVGQEIGPLAPVKLPPARGAGGEIVEQKL